MPRLQFTKSNLSNLLCYGDNLTIMQDIPDGAVDLIYLDPPFNSKRDYNAIYQDETGNPLPKQVEVFKDTWYPSTKMFEIIDRLHETMLEAGIDDNRAKFLHDYLLNIKHIEEGLQPYLTYMTYRLVDMRRVLKSTGTIYLHCDPTASHYLKTIMDCIFGHENYRNEIIWGYTGPSATKKNFPRKHDVILRYSKSDKWVFNHDAIRIPYAESSIERGKYGLDKSWGDSEGGWINEHGKIPESYWVDIPIVRGEESLQYPTQKPLALLERIIKVSSNEGDFVLDPFCGCATTMEAAHNLGRKWMGIDIAIHAIKRVARVRLHDRLGLELGKDYEILGVPNDIEGAEDLWRRDPYHFQKWAVEEIGGYDTGPVAGGKIDGRIWYRMPDSTELGCMAIEVKGGKNISPSFLLGLASIVSTHDDVDMAGLVTMRPITGVQLANFNKEIARVGSFEVNGVEYKRLQLLSAEEIVQGKRFEVPGRIQGERKRQPVIPGITRKKG
ncbi:MAG: site-specific DNA-methyltransferase [Proteobacteria bacterium]|nr:site-specific DNA-methyltransferase [Pseudomonadota bacterium]